MNTNNNQAVREDIENLLPWHAAGTLDRRDAQRVEEALANDGELARRFALVREELGETIHLNETLGAPSGRAMEQLFAKIDAEPARSPKMSFSLGAWLTNFAASLSPRTLAYAATAAVLAIVLQAAVITGVIVNERSNQGVFQTASYPSAGTFVVVRFAPDVTAAEVTNFLESNRVAVVDGPKLGGMYKVRIADGKLPKEEVGRVLSRLQGDKVIGFIAPTD
jgi:anti-sigma factor RsiW